MRVFYPRLYKTVRDHPDLFLGATQSAGGGHSNDEKTKQRNLSNAYLRRTLEADPNNAIELLQPFSYILLGVPEAQALFIERGSYDSVAEVIDAEAVYDALVKIYGAEISSTDYPQNRALPSGERLARQFAYIHNQVQVEGNASSDSSETEEGQEYS